MKHLILATLVTGLVSFLASAEEIHIATGEYAPWASAELAHDGITNRLVRDAFAESGVEVIYHYMPWKRALEATKVGKYTATSFWSYSHERAQAFLHSDALSDLPLSLFHKKTTHIKDWSLLADLSYLRFGATRGYSYTDEFWDLERRGVLRVSISNSDIENFKKLLSDQIDVFPVSTYTGWYLLSKHFPTEDVQRIQVQEQPLKSNKEYLLFSREDPRSEDLLKRFNRGLQILKERNALEHYTRHLLRQCCDFIDG